MRGDRGRREKRENSQGDREGESKVLARMHRAPESDGKRDSKDKKANRIEKRLTRKEREKETLKCINKVFCMQNG